MIDRYHLDLAVLALVVGAVVALIDAQVPAVSRRTIGLAAGGGALLGSWGNPRGVVWLVPAMAVALWADDPERPHPLGRYTVVLSVVALVGIWAAVPDTEPPLSAAGVLFPIAVLHAVRGRVPGPGATVALVVAIAGAVWVGSAGWGSALTTVGAVGLIASGPVVIGFGRVLPNTHLVVLVALQAAVGLVLPRSVMSRPVAVAVAVVVVVNAALAALGWAWGRRATPRLR